jgi:hypothetical protein
MTLIVYLVGAGLIIAAAVARVGDFATLFNVTIVAASLAIVAVIFTWWRRASLQRAIETVRGSESVVATGMIEAPHVDAAGLIAELRRLGFELAGATDTAIGGGDPIRTWVLIEAGGTGTTWVEVGIAGRAIAIFLSRGADGRFLETSFPDGATIDHPNLFARPIGTSIDAAVLSHREILAHWTDRAGPPLVVGSLEDYLRVETELRERTGGLRIAEHIERVVTPGLKRWAICAVIATVAFFVLVLLPGP